MPDPTLPPPPAVPSDIGATCKRCGSTTFTTSWQVFADGTKHVRMSCGTCQAFIRYLPQRNGDRAERAGGSPEGKEPAPREPGYAVKKAPADLHEAQTEPPPDDWQWLGYVRSADNRWRPIALCDSLSRCWEAMLGSHMQGDLLAVPVHAVRRKGPLGEHPADSGE